MSHAQTISTIRECLRSTFASLDAWFDRPPSVRQFHPASGRWSIDQVLEHVSLTNHFLMLTLGKWVPIAEQRFARGERPTRVESELDRLLVIGDRGSFGWERPEHMEPSGVPSLPAVRERLHTQLRGCEAYLDRLANGCGSLCQITMTVNNLGKLDLYEWMYFLLQHARRHLQQMEAIESELITVDSNQ